MRDDLRHDNKAVSFPCDVKLSSQIEDHLGLLGVSGTGWSQEPR